MLHPTLLRHQWKRFVRSLERRRFWLVVLAVVPLASYVIFVLVGMGLLFDKVFYAALRDKAPVTLLNEHLLSALIALFAFRFFFQRPIPLKVRPYLHLPIPRDRLIRHLQLASLFSIHNLAPLLFLLPFWTRFVLPDVGTWAGLIWLASIVLCLLLSHSLNMLMRLVLDRHLKTFLVLLGSVIGFQVVDQALGTTVIPRLSQLFFDAVLAGHLPVVLLLAAFTAVFLTLVNAALRHRLRQDPIPPTSRRAIWPTLPFGLSRVRNLILLELKMMVRNKRPKQYALISILFATVYTAVLLFEHHRIDGHVANAFLGLFASGSFAMNYGQLMFAWESRYFDGLLARDVQPQQLVLAKYMLLQGSCLVTFLISLPLFVWLAPRLLTLHVAFLFYNAGVTSVLMLALAVRNQKRISLSRSHLLNYQGFSLLHWLWLLPTITPPALLLFLLSDEPGTAYAAIAGLGLINMVLAWPWSQFFARQLTRRKHAMAAGFRRYEQ